MFRIFESLIDPFASDRLDQPPSDLLAFYWRFIGQAWPFFLAVAVTGGLLAIVSAALFAYVGVIVDGIEAAASPAAFFDAHFWLLVWVAALVLLIEPALVFIHVGLLNQSIVPAFTNLIRWQNHRYLLRQSMAFFANDFAGRVAQKMMQTSLALRRSVAALIDAVWYVSVFWLSSLAILLGLDVLVALPLLAWLCAYAGTLWVFVPRIKTAAAASSESQSQLTGRVVDSYTNIQTVKLFGHAEREDDYAREALRDHQDRTVTLMGRISGLETLVSVLNALLLAAHGGLALWLWSHEALSVGALAASTALVMRVTTMSHWIMFVATEVAENVGVVRDGVDTIAQPHEVVDAPEAGRLEVGGGEIRYERVNFGYGEFRTAAGPVIDDLSLTVAPGEKVGLVGRSGAGKSTLVNLLLRFHDLQSGRILIDGQDIGRVRQESLRSHIGVVTQDSSLLHRSVLDNIRYGRPDAPFEQVVAAAERAHAHDFILDLEDGKGRRGYDAHVGERGVKLSGGQRQRIAIARVLLKNAPILVLDEATSALDSEVEAAIQEQLFNLMAGKTVIAIAHRLSTIAAMDRLVILDAGRVIETGSHHDLLARGGLYASLWSRQSAGFIAGDKEVAE